MLSNTLFADDRSRGFSACALNRRGIGIEDLGDRLADLLEHIADQTVISALKLTLRQEVDDEAGQDNCDTDQDDRLESLHTVFALADLLDLCLGLVVGRDAGYCKLVKHFSYLLKFSAAGYFPFHSC